LKDGVNDTKLAFSYTVPTGQVFVMGDNRLQSADSRYHPQDPFIPVSSILGQPSFIIWPLNHVGSLN
jgi:signal peptidase I